MQPSPTKNPIAEIAQAVGAKAPTAEAIIERFTQRDYAVRQLGIVVADIKKALTGLNGNAKKINELVSGVSDFIESDFNK